MKKSSNNIKNTSINLLKLDNFFPTKRKNILFDKARLTALMKSKNFKEAYNLTLQNINIKIDDSDLWYLMGVVCRINEDTGSASICLKKALSLNPNDRNLIVLYCFNCMDRSLFQEALKVLNKFQSEIIFPDILNAYALVYRGLGKDKLALNYFLQTLKLDSSIENLFYNYAVFLSSLKKHRLAIKYYKKSIKLSPDHFNALFNISSSHIALRNFSEAKNILLKIISLKPNDTAASFNLAIIHTMRREPKKAKIIYNKILDLSPNNIDALINMANLNYSIKNYNEALEYITQVLNLDNKNIDALNIYSASLYELKDYKKSIIQSNKVLDLDSSNLIAIMNLTNAYYFNKDWELLEKSLENLRNIDPCNPLLASLDPLFSYDHDIVNKSKFIKDPLKYVKEFKISNYISQPKVFIKGFLEFSKEIPSEKDPDGKTTINGLQTLPTVFEYNNDLVKDLQRIIEGCIEDYRNYFSDSSEYFISRWPSDSLINGWIVYLKNQGMQTSHNHLSGWLSGVIYLNIPKTENFEDGAIKFSLHGYGYPKLKKNIPEKIIKPLTGSIVLFPSSLYHSTIPFDSKEERISLAFDILPGKHGKRIGLE